MAEQKRSKKIGRSARVGKRDSAKTIANKKRKAEKQERHLQKAKDRRQSADFTTPVAELRQDGAVKVRAGTTIKRGTKRHREIIERRRDQAKKYG